MIRIFVEGVGLLGPGLPGWRASCPVLAGGEGYRGAPTVVVASDLLPPAERRRTSVSVKLALTVGHEAFVNAGRDAAVTATVFTSSCGDENVHYLCEALASPQRDVSPTRFHNSVHNAAAGYWGIATRSQEASTSLCAYDASFAAGLLEAAAQATVNFKSLALIAYDQPYPEPLNTARPIGAAFGVALVVAPEITSRTFAALDVTFVTKKESPTRMADSGLEAMRVGTPAARSLPLLAALACGASENIVIEYVAGTHLRIAVAPCQ
ncbi:MAG: beta-ketoacyl synthase chain length factor [Burkholderiales bacterium]